jgi:hypothetical protein
VPKIYGGDMPDLRNCFRHEGKVFCWDAVEEKVVEIKMTDVPLDKVPEKVLIAMLNMATKKEN